MFEQSYFCRHDYDVIGFLHLQSFDVLFKDHYALQIHQHSRLFIDDIHFQLSF